MVKAVALHAKVSLSEPGSGVTLLDRDGRVADQPGWVSLDVLVEIRLDDRRTVSPAGRYVRGGPVERTRHAFEQDIRDLIFSQPRDLPHDPPPEPPQLVGALQPYDIDTTLEALSELPLSVTLTDEVEALSRS